MKQFTWSRFFFVALFFLFISRLQYASVPRHRKEEEEAKARLVALTKKNSKRRPTLRVFFQEAIISYFFSLPPYLVSMEFFYYLKGGDWAGRCQLPIGLSPGSLVILSIFITRVTVIPIKRAYELLKKNPSKKVLSTSNEKSTSRVETLQWKLIKLYPVFMLFNMLSLFLLFGLFEMRMRMRIGNNYAKDFVQTYVPRNDGKKHPVFFPRVWLNDKKNLSAIINNIQRKDLDDKVECGIENLMEFLGLPLSKENNEKQSEKMPRPICSICMVKEAEIIMHCSQNLTCMTCAYTNLHTSQFKCLCNYNWRKHRTSIGYNIYNSYMQIIKKYGVDYKYNYAPEKIMQRIGFYIEDFYQGIILYTPRVIHILTRLTICIFCFYIFISTATLLKNFLTSIISFQIALISKRTTIIDIRQYISLLSGSLLQIQSS